MCVAKAILILAAILIGGTVFAKEGDGMEGIMHDSADGDGMMNEGIMSAKENPELLGDTELEVSAYYLNYAFVVVDFKLSKLMAAIQVSLQMQSIQSRTCSAGSTIINIVCPLNSKTMALLT